MNIILFGPPGAGKGTISEILSKEHQYFTVGVGNILRENIASKSQLGLKIKSITERGDLVSDDLVTNVVDDYLSNLKFRDHLILDGFPRTIQQAKNLDWISKKLNLHFQYAIYLKAPNDVIIKRLKARWVCPNCGSTFNKIERKEKLFGICDNCQTKLIQRPDDKKENIQVRLKNYNVLTAPLIDFYRQKKKLIEIDATQPLPKIINNILNLENSK